jgi:hypothetical protein
MGKLDAEMSRYDEMKPEMEAHYRGKWVVFRAREFVGAYDTLDNAASEAIRLYGRGPYLIRQVGRPPVPLPASVMFKRAHADR